MRILCGLIYTPGSTNIAGWKMDRLTLNGDVYVIEHRIFSRDIHSIARYVSLPAG